MPLFRSRHPKHSLEWAARLANLMGVLCILFTALAYLFSIPPGSRFGQEFTFVAIVGVSVIFIPLFLAPGILYLVCAAKMLRLKRWAAITILTFASIHTAVLFAFISFLGLSGYATGIDIFLPGVLLLASAMLILFCAQGLPATRKPITAQPTGHAFEPIMSTNTAAFPTPPKSLKR